MKKTLKYTLLIAFTLALQNQLWQNFSFDQNVWTIVKVAFILAIFEIFLKPIVKILLLPINILTLGLFRIVINTVGLYLAVFLLADFQISSIHTSSFVWQGILIPALSFQAFWTYVVNSTTQNFLFAVFKYIIKSKRK